MKSVRLASCILFVMLLSAPALAFGVSPARKTYDYAASIEGHLTLVNNQRENLDLYLVPRGEFAEHVEISPATVILNAEDVEAKVSYTITIPRDALEPGKHRIDLVILTFEPEQARDVISASAGVASQVIVEVPYDGAYLESRIDYSKGSSQVVVPLFNKGTEPTRADVTLSVYGPTNELIRSIRSSDIAVDERSYAEVPIDLPELNPGMYLLRAKIDYSGRTVNLERVVEVGKPRLLAADLEATLSGGIVKLTLPVESQWNEDISEAYAIHDISTTSGTFIERIKTPTISIDAFGDGELIAYWESPGEDDYALSITLFYDGETHRIDELLSVTPTGTAIGTRAANVAAGRTSGWLIFGVLMLVLFNLILVTIVLRRKR